MIPAIYTQYGSFVRLQSKSLAFATYHLTKAGTIHLILRESNMGKSHLQRVVSSISQSKWLADASGEQGKAFFRTWITLDTA
jgi:hypothetical protein